MSSMSYQEKSAWGTLVSLLVIGALYFSSVVNLWRADQLHLPAMFGLSVGFTILLTVVLAGYHIIVAAIFGGQDEDERDQLIGWRAGNASGIFLGVAVISIVLMIVMDGVFEGAFWQQPAIVVNALILGVFLSTMVELVLTIWFHRKGI